MPVNATFVVAIVSLALGLYMNTRDDGITLLSTLVNFGAMTAFLALHVSVFVALRRPQRQPRLGAPPGAFPLIGFVILLYVVINAQRGRPAARLRLARPSAWSSWSSSYATGRRPQLSGQTARRSPSMPDVVATYRPTADELAYTFGGRPAGRSGQAGHRAAGVHGGLLRRPGPRAGTTCRRRCVQFPYLNPVTGPFHVEGAEPGDTLALHFAAIEPARDWAVSSTFPHFGALTSTSHTATLQPPLEERVWLYEIDRAAGTVRFQASRSATSRVDLPLDPMHGTVGVAPAAFEARMTITPDAHGGNMDTPELRAGVTVYFGVNVHGRPVRARRRPRPPGPRRGLRRRRRGRDGHHRGRRRDQGRVARRGPGWSPTTP